MKKRVALITVFVFILAIVGADLFLWGNISLLTWRADHGSRSAAHRLGLIYSTPDMASHHNLPLDYARANQWFRQAADAGDAQSQYDLGLSYAEGTGVAQDDAQAAEWYKKSAFQNYAPAELAVGLAYLHGTGVPKDEAYAVNALRDAMDDGASAAAYHLANLYLAGIGVKKSFSKAAALLKQYAATTQKTALPEALNLLGSLYLQGRGVKQDAVMGAKWTWQAAQAGDADAQFNMGRLLLTGTGVVQNEALAHEMLEKSARQENAQAHALLNHLGRFKKDIQATVTKP